MREGCRHEEKGRATGSIMDFRDFHKRVRPILVALPAVGLAAGLAVRATGRGRACRGPVDRRDAAGAGRAGRRDRREPSARRRRARHRRGAVDDRGAGLRRVPRRRRRGADVCRRAIPRGLRRAAGAARDDGAARARAAERDALPRRRARRGAARRHRARRPPAHPPRRRGAGRRRRGRGRRAPRPVGADRRVAAGALRDRRSPR